MHHISTFLPKFHKKLKTTNPDTYEYLRDNVARERFAEYVASVGFYQFPLKFEDWLQTIN